MSADVDYNDEDAEDTDGQRNDVDIAVSKLPLADGQWEMNTLFGEA